MITTRTPAARPARRRALVALVALGGLLVPAGCGSDEQTYEPVPVTPVPGPYDYDYTIPLGTGTRIARGETPEIIDVNSGTELGTALTVHLGETLRIINLDTKSHEVGTFYLLAGSTLTYRFNAAGVFQGTCTTHPSGEFTLTVLDA